MLRLVVVAQAEGERPWRLEAVVGSVLPDCRRVTFFFEVSLVAAFVCLLACSVPKGEASGQAWYLAHPWGHLVVVTDLLILTYLCCPSSLDPIVERCEIVTPC